MHRQTEIFGPLGVEPVTPWLRNWNSYLINNWIHL